MKKKNERIVLIAIVLALIAVIAWAFVFPGFTHAAEPQDYHWAMVQCSGLGSVSLVQFAQQKYDTWYGWQHSLTTPAQWVGTYESRVNEFALTVGCPSPVLIDGHLTLFYKLTSVWMRYYIDPLAPQMQ